jgi:hypothetical protein
LDTDDEHAFRSGQDLEWAQDLARRPQPLSAARLEGADGDA